MEEDYVNLDNIIVTLHEGWAEHKSPNESKWRKVWLQLEGRRLYLFYSQNVTQEAPFATLNIGGGFKFEKRDGSEKTGYKFDIILNKSVNKFKASKFSEREQWRAFMEGVATGEVSDKIDLPSDSLNKIRQALKQYSSDSVSISQSPNDLDYAYSSASGSFNMSEFDDSDSGCGDPEYYLEPTANAPPPPNLGLVFYTDKRKTDFPSWFFLNCSRELAIEILHKGIEYGNTLMRKGIGKKSNLVISKKMETGKENFTHYEVITVPDGYKLNVDNPHRSMKTLTEIMNFFVQTSGLLTTAPMTCNNLQRIGITPDHEYNPRIISTFEQSLPDLNKPSKINTVPSKQINVLSQQGAAQRTAHWNQHRSQSIPDLKPGILKMNSSRKMSIDIAPLEEDDTSMSQLSLTTQLKQAFKQHKSRSLDVPPPPPLNPPPPLKLHTNVSLDSPPALPPNHPPKLNTSPFKKQLTPPGVSTHAFQIQSPPEVQDPMRKDEGDTQSLIGDVPAADFKKKLNEMFGDRGLSQSVPSVHPFKTNKPRVPLPAPPTTETPKSVDKSFNDDSDIVDRYQNISAIRQHSIYNN